MSRAIPLASFVVIVWGLIQAKPVLVPLLLAALLAFMMGPLMQALLRRKVPEWMALTLSAILLFLPVLTLAILVIGEGKSLIQDYPRISASLREHWNTFAAGHFAQQLGLSEYLNIDEIGSHLTEGAGQGFSLLAHGLRAMAEAGTHLMITLLFAIVMLGSRHHLRLNFERIVSKPGTLDSIVSLIEGFLIGRLGIALCVAILDVLILRLFDCRYSVLLGSLLGLSTLIPVIGFFVGLLPIGVIAISTGHSLVNTAFLSACLYVIASIESHFVTPQYLGNKLNLNLLATFLGIFVGESIWGFWGMFLSVPLLGIIRISLEVSHDYQAWADLLASEPRRRKPRTV